jgi:hypothetical protein
MERKGVRRRGENEEKGGGREKGGVKGTNREGAMGRGRRGRMRHKGVIASKM